MKKKPKKRSVRARKRYDLKLSHPAGRVSERSADARVALPAWITGLASEVHVSYATALGVSLVGMSEQIIAEALASGLRGKVNLVFTSPPFPLIRKKKYDNLQGDAYKRWFSSFAPLLSDLLAPKGSIVVELGNTWELGQPVMSTTTMESLLEFKRRGQLFLCQECIWHNPARLPGPAEWVTIRRERLKDSFSRVWWMSREPHPKADNRKVLLPYSDSMKKLLSSRRYNGGKRPSEHVIGTESFLRDHGGSISPSVIAETDSEATDLITFSNTGIDKDYRMYCERNGIAPHPARMPADLVNFFVKFLTDPGDVVLDPFAGTNTTGAAAQMLGRQWIAIEASADYARSGRARFPELARQTRTDS
jgi:DNA modification methylase